MEIKLSGKLNKEDLDDIRRSIRSKWYWPKIILRSLPGIAFLGLLVWSTVAGLAYGTKVNWRGIGSIWAFLVLLAIFLYFRGKTAHKKELSAMATALPDWITVAVDGLHYDGPNGASGFQPWAAYKRWHEGKRTVVVEYAAHKGFAMLPISGLTESERQVLRGLFDSHLVTNSKGL
jgi:hypothetical protein